MYSAKAVEQAKAAAAPLIAAERARFAPAREIVLQYAGREHRAPLYLAGGAGIAALRGEPIAVDGEPLEFYTTEPRYHATAILSTIEAARDTADLEKLDAEPDVEPPAQAAELDKKSEPAAATGGSSVAFVPPARPILAAAFWDPVHFVEEDTRRVVVLWPLPRPPGGISSTSPAAIPATACGGGDILCFPPELRLYEIYRGLCDLTRAEDWPRLLADEAALFAALSDLRKRVVAVTGGREQAAVPGPLERRFARGSGRAVIPTRGGGPMQVVSANDLETDLASIKRGAERTGAKIQTRVVEIGFPTDLRLRRLKVYLKGGRGVTPILDVFNAAEYAPVPLAPAAESAGLTEGGRARKRRDRSPAPRNQPAERVLARDGRTRAVSLFAELRFRVADLWTALLLFERSVIDKSRARQLVADAHAAMIAVRTEIAKSTPAVVLPVAADAYLGVYVPELVLNRRGKRRYDGKMPIVRA